MTRATGVLVATTILGFAAALWLYLDNRALRAALADQPAAIVARAPAPQAALMGEVAVGMRAPPPTGIPAVRATPPPALPEVHEETRMERRARGTSEFAAMFGRRDGETADEYRARIAPLIKAGLAVPRVRADEMRKVAEDKAHVTSEQSKQLDRAFDKVYGDVLAYTDKAIADRQLSPYERNVAGWLEYAGGLGTILNDAQGQIGKVLSPDQLKAMSDAGFEWGEYLGIEAPWEKLTPPPPAPR